MSESPNWIDDILHEVTPHVETPVSWLWWSLTSAISATAGNNYFVSSFNGNHIYKANLYVMLLGESGLGKAYGINLAKLLVQKADVTRIIAGRSSIQAIVTDLATSRTRESGKPPLSDSRAFIINGELSSAVISDVSALAILTDLFDGTVNDDWINNLKMGKERIKEPYITALFGSSPSHFYGTIPTDNIQGGYIGRNLIVYEERRAQTLDPFSNNGQPETEQNFIKDYLIPKYVPHLEKIAGRKGQLRLTESARKEYNTWRRSWREQKNNDKTGFIVRVPDHVIKVSMCLALARYDNEEGLVDEFDISEARDKVIGLIYANKMTTAGKGLDPSAGQSKLVLDLLLAAENQELSRRQILSRGHGNFDTYNLERILETLEEMRWITKERIVAGKNTDWLIKLAGEPLEGYLKWKNRKG